MATEHFFPFRLATDALNGYRTRFELLVLDMGRGDRRRRQVKRNLGTGERLSNARFQIIGVSLSMRDNGTDAGELFVNAGYAHLIR